MGAAADELLLPQPQPDSLLDITDYVRVVQDDMVVADLGVQFDDICSLHSVKQILREVGTPPNPQESGVRRVSIDGFLGQAVVLPMLLPEVFVGIRSAKAGETVTDPQTTHNCLRADCGPGRPLSRRRRRWGWLR
jgi:hypothetical protein